MWVGKVFVRQVHHLLLGNGCMRPYAPVSRPMLAPLSPCVQVITRAAPVQAGERSVPGWAPLAGDGDDGGETQEEMS